MKKVRFLLTACALLAAAAGVVWLIQRSSGRTLRVPPDQLLYERNCAICHGSKGDGKGEAAYLLQPKPRNFLAGKFRLVTSQNLQPTREDLLRVIAEGIPGTPMPSWAHLPEKERGELADYILRLNWQGWVEKGLKLGDKQAAAEKYATEMTRPGDSIPIPPEPPVTAQALAQGREYYLKVCAKCHGQDGKGKRDPTWRTSEGFPSWARDLSHGVFKGGREGKQLYLRFFTGLPGTPMPSSELPGEQVWHVVHYIQSLSNPQAQEQAQIRAKEVATERVKSLPSGPDDPAWQRVSEVRIPLMALWWHENYIEGLKVRSLHDGERLAVRLEWNDTTRDVEGILPQHFSDGAAVQLAASQSPPLFAMGRSGEPVTLWHWKALWSEDQKQFQDVGTVFPSMHADAYYGREKGWRSSPTEDQSFLPAAELNNPVALPGRTGAVEEAQAAGLGTVTSRPPGTQTAQAASGWKGGVWSVQLIQSLGSGPENALLRPGGRTAVAFAVWDGKAGDRNGQKSVSIWNTLALGQ